MKARFALIVATLVLSACAGTPKPEQGPRINHVVLCWLKQPGDARGRAALIDASKQLRSIPGVRSVTAGPSLDSGRSPRRPQVDASFDVGIVMTFENAAALESYQHHPKHLAAVRETLAPSVSRFVVYDIVER